MRISAADAIKRGLLSPKQLSESGVKASKGPPVKDMEGVEQSVVIKYFRAKYPDVGSLLIHIPNGGSRKNAYEGWRLKEQGVRAGVSDLFLPVARGSYHGLWIEMKATPPNDSKPTDSQLLWLQDMLAQGYQAHLCLGQDAAIEKLDAYMELGPYSPKN